MEEVGWMGAGDPWPDGCGGGEGGRGVTEKPWRDIKERKQGRQRENLR